MPKSDYSANAILNACFGKTSNFGALATAPSIYIALCTAIPLPSATGSTITEVSYTGYARVNVAASGWNAAGGRAITNNGAINFGTMTAGAGGTVNCIALVDASSAGNLLWYNDLLLPQAISTGNLTRSTTTATVTLTGHGYTTGDSILITGVEQPEYNGFKVITVVDANTFTFAVGNAPATPGTATTGNSMQAWKATTLAVSANIQPQFAAGTLAIVEN